MTTWDSTLKTFVAGEVLTAADLNENVRDPLAALSGAWNSYTPTLGVFTAGNGTADGKYIRVGSFVVFTASFTFGSTSAAAVGRPTLTLPVTLVVGGPMTGRFNDVSSALYRTDVSPSTGAVTLGVLGTNGLVGNCSTTVPFTWTTGDILSVAGIYEAA